jgi:hypothetical protein
MWEQMAVDMRLPLSLGRRAMFTLAGEPFLRNLTKEWHLPRRHKTSVAYLSAEVAERAFRFFPRVERGAMSRSGLVAKVDAPSPLLCLPDAPHSSTLLRSILLLGGDFLKQSGGGFGDCHLVALPTGNGVRGYSESLGQSDLSPLKLAPESPNFLATHHYT